MKQNGSKLSCNAQLVVDKFDPKELVDLYVTADNFNELCKIFGGNHVTVALRMKGIG